MISNIRIGFLGCKELAKKIIFTVYNKGFNIIGVVTPSSTSLDNNLLRSMCEDEMIPLLTYQELFKLKPDIVFSINYWRKIEETDINSVPLGIVNLHHSYRLMYGGRNISSFAILNSDITPYHGTTLHYINGTLDNGLIIDSKKCKILENDTAYSLFQKVEHIAYDMFFDNFEKILQNKIISTLKIDENAVFYKKEKIKEKEFNFFSEEEKRLLYKHVRAWTFPDTAPPYINYKGEKILLILDENKKGEDI